MPKHPSSASSSGGQQAQEDQVHEPFEAPTSAVRRRDPGRRAVLRAAAATGLLALSGCGTRTAPAAAGPDVPLSVWTDPAQEPGARFHQHGDRNGNQVALTFHGGGDRTLAEAELRHLERAKAPCTVFAIGQWLEQEHGLARRILSGGHELGNHTYTHPDTRGLTRSQLRREIERCRDVLVRQTGSPGLGVRAPENDLPVTKVELASADAGYRSVIGWDIDPQDFFDPGTHLVLRRVLAQARGGSIVFLHLGHAGTVDALPPLLDGLRSRGLEPVTAGRLLQL